MHGAVPIRPQDPYSRILQSFGQLRTGMPVGVVFSCGSNAENARTTAQCARAARLARQADPRGAFQLPGESTRMPRSESRVGRRHPSAERQPGSQAAPTMVYDENRAPSAATFLSGAPV